MSDVMMKVLQQQNESLARQVKQLGPENERVRKLLAEFDMRHDRDQAEIGRLRATIDRAGALAMQGASAEHIRSVLAEST